MDNKSINLIQRKTNAGTVWQYRFEIASVNGKRKFKTKSGFATRKEAFDAGVQAYLLYERVGDNFEPTRMSYADFLDKWMLEDVMKTRKPSTIHNYQKYIKLYIKPYLGSYRLKNIKRKNIKDFLYKMSNEGFSRNTISVCRGIISNSFNYALECEYLQKSPAVNINILSKGGFHPEKEERRKPHVYITKEQMEKIFERFPEGSSSYVPLMIGYHTGLRLSEVYALVWEDIDFENRKMSINRQISWQADIKRTKNEKIKHNGSRSAGNGFWYFSEPKYGSYRTIDLDDELYDLLVRERDKQLAMEKSYSDVYRKYYVNKPLIFVDHDPQVVQTYNKLEEDSGKFEVHFITRRDDGSYITSRTIKHTSRVIHHQMGFTQFDFHSLRHTHATMLKEKGAPDVYIQRRLGHKKLDVTLNIYTNHLTEQFHDEGKTILNDLYE